MKTAKLSILHFVLTAICSCAGFAQKSQDWLLEKMPPDLETDYALSALPARLRDQATVYLLDPKKGYYVGRQGTNGFATFINRTQWEWAEFAPDAYTAISYDAEGVKTYLPPYFAVAEMRASGKYTPAEIKDIVIKRVKDGTYKAPTRTGVSYMLCPINRNRVDKSGMVNEVMPHYMFYAPRVDDNDMGGKFDGHGPFAVDSGDFLDKEHSIFNYIILPAGDTEKAKILEENKDLLRRLAEYKPYFKIKIGPNAGTHQH
jgi:hypothetical protein